MIRALFWGRKNPHTQNLGEFFTVAMATHVRFLSNFYAYSRVIYKHYSYQVFVMYSNNFISNSNMKFTEKIEQFLDVKCCAYYGQKNMTDTANECRLWNFCFE